MAGLAKDEQAVVEEWRRWLKSAECMGRFDSVEQLGEHLVVRRYVLDEPSEPTTERPSPEAALDAALRSGELVYFHDGSGVWAFQPRRFRPGLKPLA